MATIGRINTVVSATTAPLTRGLGIASKSIKGFGSGIGGLVTKFGPMAAGLAGVAGVGGMGLLVKNSLDAVDSLAKTADALGVTTEALAGLRRAGERSGVETEKLDKGMFRMQRTISAAKDGSASAAKNFDKLGLSMDHIRSLAPEEQFFQIADAINKIPDQTDKTRLAMETFGRDGTSILKILGKGADAARGELAKAAELGLAPSREDAAKIEEANDAIADMKDSFVGVGNTIAVTIAPMLTSMSAKIQSVGTFFRNAFEELSPILTEFRDVGAEVFSAISDAAGSLFGSVGGDGVNVFRSIKAVVITWARIVKTNFLNLLSVAGTVWNTIKAGASALFGFLGMTGSMTFKDIMDAVTDFMFTVEFAFQNIGPIAEFAWEKIKLGAVSLWEEIKHTLTVRIPAVWNWFLKNWKEIFFTMFDFTATVFINLGKNIRKAMKAIWDFIKSGGKDGLQFAWTPLTDGFVNTVRELPDIPERALSDLEKKLKGRADAMGKNLADGLQSHLESRRLELLGDKVKEAADVKTPEKPVFDVSDEAADKMASAVQDREGPAALERGSAEAFSAIFKAMRGDNTEDKILAANEKQLKEQKQQTATLRKIADHPGVELVMGAV